MAKVFLLVDDDNDDIELFQEALSDADPAITFYSASTGRSAIGMLKESTIQQPDIIFLDVNMPVMDGWQCLKEIKKTDSQRHIPVVMYSTAANPREVQTAFDLGALCFFTKPEIFDDLKAYLKIIAGSLGGDMVGALSGKKGISCNPAYQAGRTQMFK